MFNTLKYARMLEEVGFYRDQAETSVKILVEIMEDKLATKQDLIATSVALKQDMLSFKQELKQDIKELESKLTVRMGVMFAAFTTILTAIQALLIHFSGRSL